METETQRAELTQEQHLVMAALARGMACMCEQATEILEGSHIERMAAYVRGIEYLTECLAKALAE